MATTIELDPEIDITKVSEIKKKIDGHLSKSSKKKGTVLEINAENLKTFDGAGLQFLCYLNKLKDEHPVSLTNVTDEMLSRLKTYGANFNQ